MPASPPDAMRQFINQLLTPVYGRSVETIKEMLLLLNRYNIEHHHLLDVPLLELYFFLASLVEQGIEQFMVAPPFHDAEDDRLQV